MSTPRTIAIEGFDPEGEPQLDDDGQGSLRVEFAFFPPSWCPPEHRADLGPFASFDQEMSVAIGLPVAWEDRELFVIEAAQPTTVERLVAFLLGYRAAHRGAGEPT